MAVVMLSARGRVRIQSAISIANCGGLFFQITARLEFDVDLKTTA